MIKRLSAIIAFLFFLPGYRNDIISNSNKGDSWSGVVHFSEIRSGPGIVVYQHQMGAQITNDSGTATHSLIAEIKDKFKVTCRGQGRSFLEVGIDQDENTYSIAASIPDCTGIRVSAAGNVENTGEDETGITVPDQPLGSNRNSLRGTLVKRDTKGTTLVITTYNWHIYK